MGHWMRMVLWFVLVPATIGMQISIESMFFAGLLSGLLLVKTISMIVNTLMHLES